jgi:Flp pilus assembly protein TadD
MVLQHAARIDPANSMTHMLLARAFTASGRTGDASREFEILQRLHQDSAPPAPAAP